MVDPGIIGFLLSYVVGLYLTVWIHEGGHILFGWFAGKKFGACYVWPLLFFVAEGKVKLRLSSRSRVETFGWHYMESMKPEFNYREEMLWVSGGIVTGVICGLSCIIVGFGLLRYSDIRAGCFSFVPYSVMSVGCFSFILAILSGYPYNDSNILSSDGNRLRRLLNAKKHQLVEPIAADKLAKHLSGRFELDDRKRQEYIEQLLESPDIHYKKVGYVDLVEFYLDRGDQAKVEEVQSEVKNLSFWDDDLKKSIEATIANHGKTFPEYLTGKADG